jgi:hypothetical protein
LRAVVVVVQATKVAVAVQGDIGHLLAVNHQVVVQPQKLRFLFL